MLRSFNDEFEKDMGLQRRVKINSIKMMIDRKYVQTLYSKPGMNKNMSELQLYENMSTKQFINYREQNATDESGSFLNQVYIHTETKKKSYIVFIDSGNIIESGKFSKYLHEIIRKKDKNPILSHPITGIDTFIFIIKYPPIKEEITLLRNLLSKIKNVQIFNYPELYIYKPGNILVPKHVPMTDIEARNFLKRNNLTIDQLPKIAEDDSNTKHYGLLPGQIFKIYRDKYDIPGFIDDTITYRVVVNYSTQHIDLDGIGNK